MKIDCRMTKMLMLNGFSQFGQTHDCLLMEVQINYDNVARWTSNCLVTIRKLMQLTKKRFVAKICLTFLMKRSQL